MFFCALIFLAGGLDRIISVSSLPRDFSFAAPSASDGRISNLSVARDGDAIRVYNVVMNVNFAL